MEPLGETSIGNFQWRVLAIPLKTENEKQKEVTVTNFTNMELLFVEVAVSYLKNNELVKIETYKIPSLTSYEKVEKMVYLDYDKIEADSVYITLNDICI